MKKLLPTLKTLILALILAAGVSYISAWTGPTAAAPGGNVDSPVNVGLNHQEKLGNLFINTSLSNPYTIGLQVFGQSIFNGSVQIIDGTQGAGKVLTSNASGTASWSAVSSSGAIPGTIVTITSSGSWTVPAGVTKVLVKAWGAGGGGGGSSGSGQSGAGGGAGAYVEGLVSVTPGAVIPVSIGAGGTRGASGGSSSNGGAGGATTFNTSSIVAAGGAGGQCDGSCGYMGGAGGTTAASTGSIKLAGGNGQSGATSANTGGSGGFAPLGGQGGQSGSSAADGQVPGGGGGGDGNERIRGGLGAAGEIIIEY